jgi:DNA-binding SARP family transcriptional activator
MEFRILGPLEVAVGSERLELTGVRQQIVLATLLLNANHMVSVDRLLEAVYGEDPPPTSRSQTQISISSLRRLFAPHGPAAIISTRAPGYAIEVGEGRLDSLRFDALVAAARDAPDSAQAVAHYRDALRLWRGPALAGLDSELLRAAAGRLDEQRIAVNEDRFALELDLGRHHELTGELIELAGQYPLREQLRGLLMLALYRCGRAAEALAVYRQARRTMIDELGIEPGERLRQLERAILADDPSLDPPTQPVRIHAARDRVPGLLPADIADFVDRAEQVGRIRRHLTGAAGGEPRLAVPVVVITGQGGVGKTSLAVHAAHGLAGQFPHGQLFADLHARTASPVGPAQVLDRFLRALGVPGAQIPDGVDERAEMYRNLLAGRNVLVVLDDAAGENQVSPLLPGSAAAGVIVTSRRGLAGLGGSEHVETAVFDARTAADLLARIAGPARVQERPETAAVAGHCGHLPLALRIAGARLAARPHWNIGQLAERLADETRRLDELSHGDMHVRASFSLTYDSTSEQARRLFRRLALLDMPAFPGWLSAPLLDQPLADAEDLLDELVSAQLVQAADSGSGVHSQYRFHDLIRVFARERLAAEEPAAERTAALERALGALLYVAQEAYRRFTGKDYPWPRSEGAVWPLPSRVVEQLAGDPVSWFERERDTLVCGVRQAARAGLAGLCWTLMLTAEDFFEFRAYFDDWREAADTALAATRKARDTYGQAAMLHTRGTLHLEQYRLDQAWRDLTAAAELYEETGDDWGFAMTARNIALVDWTRGRLDDATRRNEQALAIFRRAGDHDSAAQVLRGMTAVHLDRGQLDEAMELLAELRSTEVAPNKRIGAQLLYLSGRARLLAGDPARAVADFDQALAMVLGDPVGEAHVLRVLGVARVRQGEFGQARSALLRALELAGSVGDRLAEARTLVGLSELALASGNYGQAVTFGQQAADVCRTVGAPLFEAQALTQVSQAHAGGGDASAAEAAAAAAAALRARSSGDVRAH